MYQCTSNWISRASFGLNRTMRMLWEQHVAWTRMTIISIASNLPDLGLVSNRLLRNPTDFAVALTPFYGREKAFRFGGLLHDHLVIAANLVMAAKAGNTTAAAAAEKQWYENADQMAAFLSSINPCLPKEALTAMLHQHLSLTKAEAVARLSNDYARDISLYDQVQLQALEMADALTDGIVRQFHL